MPIIKSLYKFLYNAGDKLEDHVRGYFSHFPIIYALIGGVGVVLFWRGVWHSMDFLMFMAASKIQTHTTTDLSQGIWWDGPVSLLIGSVILLTTGVFVSNFIGNEIIISGLKGEKKVAEKTEKEVKIEQEELVKVKNELELLARNIEKSEK